MHQHTTRYQYLNSPTPRHALLQVRKADQKSLDDAMMPTFQKDEILAAYMKAKFTLKSRDKPHEMVF